MITPPRITDNDIDILVVALQALKVPADTTLQLSAIDKGNKIVRQWLNNHGIATA